MCLLKGDNSGRDDLSLLQQRNRELAVDMIRRKRQEADLEKKLGEAWSKQGHFDALLSAVNRAWNQVGTESFRPLMVYVTSFFLYPHVRRFEVVETHALQERT